MLPANLLRARTRIPSVLTVLATLVGILIGLPVSTASARPDQHTIATYNTFGSRWDEVWTIGNSNEIVAVQEAGVDPANANRTLLNTYAISGYNVREYRWATDRGTRYIYWLDPNDGCTNSRVTLAMVTYNQPAALYVVPSPLPSQNARPALGLRFGDTIYYNVHAQACGVRNEALTLLDNIRAQASSYGLQWAALGDFNRAPSMADTDGRSVHSWATSTRAFVVHPNQPTHVGGNELDYMVTSLNIPNYHAVRQNFGASDHDPVYFRLRSPQPGDLIDLTADSNPGMFATFNGGSTANGTTVIMDTYRPRRSQWNLRRAQGGGASDFNIVNLDSGKCLDLYNGAYSKSGDLLDEYTCMDIPSQSFRIQIWADEPSTWAIVSNATGLCVDTMGISPRYLALYACTPKAPNQMFQATTY
ncbi:RICIN domain-containing protein (plasmid) [Kitasatospora griseola]|uniref:RICIN domain-containing protein n=1 Tax=Kitasatospora griseola TaxID=2064 RepID=UPI003855A589